MSATDALLAVQDHDTHLDQLVHRRTTLAERAAVEKVQVAVAELDAQEPTLREKHHAVAREQKRLEDEVATVEDKAQAVHAKLYGGRVTSPKELQDLQQDYDSIKRHQSHLEDQVIEVMEQAEPLEEQLAQLAARRNELTSDGRDAAAALAEAEATVDAEVVGVQAERDALVPDLPVELLAEYERLRSTMGGIAAARLSGSTCLGCNLSLSAVEVDRVKHLRDGELMHCQECDRLLVV